ncbi:uncharacterized protein EKO05_0008985 [Ascochyta rabiei]|uniref:uncharacterized protein n=1 Tax=Didymella rabiei TaxID=5454 RepID=UPI00190030B0|nr:uncharacterized protein EKO05_0008985 [Ascochyta rabiei]UPX18693.1 hypothetical protein EKO05_0008985 [Ascochyta rabiei]
MPTNLPSTATTNPRKPGLAFQKPPLPTSLTPHDLSQTKNESITRPPPPSTPGTPLQLSIRADGAQSLVTERGERERAAKWSRAGRREMRKSKVRRETDGGKEKWQGEVEPGHA